MKRKIYYPPTHLKTVPIFPSPVAWFKWNQRYIYENYADKTFSYLNGYGDYKKSVTCDNLEYKCFDWLQSYKPEKHDTSYWVRIAPYESSYSEDSCGLTWFIRGQNSMLFDDELTMFDYPLILGKKWASATKIKKLIPVSFTGKVVAFIPAGIKREDEIIVAPDCQYHLPVAFADIPQPAAEYSNKTKGTDWDVLAKGYATPDAVTDWKKVKVPAGKQKGKNIQGYYVIQTETRILGKLVSKQELWKDVRGCVPVYDNYLYSFLSGRAKHITKVIRVWSGNL